MGHVGEKCALVFYWLIWIVTAYNARVIAVRYLTVSFAYINMTYYPLLWPAFFAVIAFLAAIIYFFVRIICYRDEQRKFFLSPWHFPILSLFHALHQYSIVIAISFPGMTIGNYIMLFQFQFLFEIIFGGVILKRRPSAGQVFASILVLCASAGFLLVQYIPSTNTLTITLPGLNSDLISWGVCVFGCLCMVIRASLLRFFLLKKAAQMKTQLLMDNLPQEDPDVANIHLFAGFDDMYLTRLDDVFDDPFYDGQEVSVDVRNTFEVESLGGAAPLMVISVCVGFITGADDTRTAAYTTIPSIPWQVWVPFGVIAIAYFINPIVRAKLVIRSSTLEYTAVAAFSTIGSVIGGHFLMSSQGVTTETLTVIQWIALFIYLIGFGWYRSAIASSRRSRLAEVQMQDLQQKLPDLAAVDVQHLYDVNDRLGFESYQRVLLETAVSGDAQAWRSTAAPVLGARGMFQKDYTNKGHINFELKQREPASLLAQAIPYAPPKWADATIAMQRAPRRNQVAPASDPAEPASPRQGFVPDFTPDTGAGVADHQPHDAVAPSAATMNTHNAGVSQVPPATQFHDPAADYASNPMGDGSAVTPLTKPPISKLPPPPGTTVGGTASGTSALGRMPFGQPPAPKLLPPAPFQVRKPLIQSNPYSEELSQEAGDSVDFSRMVNQGDREK